MGRAASDRISDFVYSPKPSSEFLQKVQSSQVTHTHTHIWSIFPSLDKSRKLNSECLKALDIYW